MKRVQMTVYVDADIAQRLRESSQVAGVPLGRHAGDMLGSLIDSIEYVSAKMAEIRRSPSAGLAKLKAIEEAVTTSETVGMSGAETRGGRGGPAGTHARHGAAR